ncbi:MAG: ABC transporter ATP-binding protein [Planctomycetales bacterium]|nr:ABC transporter ATP-binding protein [Planctomycetales bacterium]
MTDTPSKDSTRGDSPNHEPPLLRCEHLVKTYDDGDVQALRDVSLSIRRGEYVAIMGPSGSGKSTMLNMLGALDVPTSGEVYFNGEPLSKMGSLDRFRSEKLGFVFQSFHLLSVLTAVGNVQVPMFETRRPRAERDRVARELLGRVGMSHRANHRPLQLSVGERQRVAIARALANDPELLLADEPTGNLDSRTAAEIFNLLDKLHDEGMTIVLITHDPELGHRAARIVRMRDGAIEDDLPAPARAPLSS